MAVRVRQVATLCDLDLTLLSRTTHRLSVGQAQRVCIARAMVAEPSLIAFDEPLSALDRHTAEEVIAAIERARLVSRSAMLFVTHDLGFARRIADQIGVLSKGHLIESSTASAFFEAPSSAYGRALIDAARCIGDLPEAA